MIDSHQAHYCQTLLAVNKTCRVQASEAIYNQQGVLLLSQGAELDEKRTQLLLQHKLLKPLEHCVAIEKMFDARQLFDYANRFAAKLPGLEAVTQTPEFQKNLRLMCLFYEKHPLLRQNLTLLALRAKGIYYRGLFSAIAGLAIAYKLDLTPQEMQATFIGGLFHDVGYLYLAPELSSKTQNFSAAEWKALQAHPIIAKRFMDMVPQLPLMIGEAIADHHERIDGTGYPRHLFGDKISVVSQIISATDHIIHNHDRYSSYGVYAHQMLLIALKLSDNIYFESVYNAASLLFKHAPTPQEALKQPPSNSLLHERQQKLAQHFASAKQLALQLMRHSQHPGVRSIAAAMGRLGICVNRSGILQPEQECWLRHLSPEDTHTEEGVSLLEISVIQDQIYDQLVHLKNLMERLIESMPEGTQERSEYHLTLANIELSKATMNLTAGATGQ